MRVFKIVLVSQALCLLACSGAPVASDAGGLAALTTQSEPKEAGNAVSPIALGDDFVLFAGGNGSEGADKTAFELLNLSTLQYGQPPDRPHHVAGFSSVLLDESHLLVANNWDPSLRPRDPGEQEAWEPPAAAAIWNLSTTATETTPAPTRGYFRADVAALPDGRVLLVGCAKDKESHAEIRDSATGEWSDTAAPLKCKLSQLLETPSGVLTVPAGRGAPELFDAGSSTWTALSEGPNPAYAGAVVLDDGRVLFYGSRNPPRNDAAVAAVLDLKTQVWTPTEAVPIDRGVKYRPGQVALGRGGPLLLGGELDRACTDQVFQLDTDSLTWTSVKSLAEPVEGAAVVELPDGRVLLYGGDGARGEGGPCRNQRSGALIYEPG